MTPFKLTLPKAMGAFAITWRRVKKINQKKHIQMYVHTQLSFNV
jgi:hypothetical protein